MTRGALRRTLLAAGAAALGCGDGSMPAAPDAAPTDAARPVDDVAPEPVTVQPLHWNAAMADLGAIAAVVESGDDVVVFGARGMQWLSGGAVLARDMRVMAWRDAASVPAGDGGAGRWVLAVDGAGRVWRVRDRMALEDVTGRYGLTDHPVRSVAALDATRTVFGADAGFAVADGTRVLRWSAPGFAVVVVGGGRVAARTAAGARVFEVMGQRYVDYAVEGATAVALDADGRLVVGTAAGALWREQPGGSLVVAAPTTAGAVRSIARAGSSLWVIAGGGLGVLDAAQGVRLAAGVAVAADARLVGSGDGSVWVLGEGRLSRYALSVDPRVQQWEQEVRPVFARRCTPCHLPGGTANIDLTRYRYWVDEASAIRRAVVAMQRMPPPPATLSAEERAAIARWLDSPADAGVDAGVDAGRPDAGRPDAGTMDAGVADGGARDAGRRDVGMMDAGRRDVGVVDGGTRDGGTRDAGRGFAAVYPIIQRACVRCHGGSGALNMSTEAMAFANLVGPGGVGVVAMGGACGASGLHRVVPGDAMMSLLYLKIRGGAPPCGSAMPRGAATLPAGDIAIVRAWIEAGARR